MRKIVHIELPKWVLYFLAGSLTKDGKTSKNGSRPRSSIEGGCKEGISFSTAEGSTGFAKPAARRKLQAKIRA
jgi:hypothetical protein